MQEEFVHVVLVLRKDSELRTECISDHTLYWALQLNMVVSSLEKASDLNTCIISWTLRKNDELHIE